MATSIRVLPVVPTSSFIEPDVSRTTRREPRRSRAVQFCRVRASTSWLGWAGVYFGSVGTTPAEETASSSRAARQPAACRAFWALPRTTKSANASDAVRCSGVTQSPSRPSTGTSLTTQPSVG